MPLTFEGLLPPVPPVSVSLKGSYSFPSKRFTSLRETRPGTSYLLISLIALILVERVSQQVPSGLFQYKVNLLCCSHRCTCFHSLKVHLAVSMPAQPCCRLCNITQNWELYLNSSWSAHCASATGCSSLCEPTQKQTVHLLCSDHLKANVTVSHQQFQVRIIYQDWIQWQLPNVIGRMRLLHAKRTKCPIYWYGWWRHGTQLVLCLIWVCLGRVILHDKHIPWILPSVHWEENLLSILGHGYDVGLCHAAVYANTVCAPLSLYVCLLNFGI